MTRRAIENSDEVKEVFCNLIADGETMTAICRQQGMPSRETIRGWLRKDSEFDESYHRAMTIRQMYWTEEVLSIADGLPKGATSRDIARARTKIDARKWATGRAVGGMRGSGTGNPSESTKRRRKSELAKQLRIALDNGLSLEDVIAELEH